MPSFCGVPTIPHPSLTLLFFYLSHSHFSISISILSQDAFFPPHFSLQMGKDMAANNKPLKKRDNKQPFALFKKPAKNINVKFLLFCPPWLLIQCSASLWCLLTGSRRRAWAGDKWDTTQAPSYYNLVLHTKSLGGWTDGWTDGRMEGWMNGWMDGRM